MEGATPEEGEEKDILNESNKNEKKKKKKKHKHHKNKDGDSDSEKKTIEKKNPGMMKDLIGDCFVLLHLIGKGSFGQIYISYNLRENLPVSVKKEEKKPGKTPQLKTESKIYQTLLNIQADDVSGAKPFAQDEVTGVPKFYGVGELPDCYYMIIDFLGPNLIELFNYCGCKKFTISTVCLIALQVLNRIENIHKHHYLHRDIKPENFLIGIHEKSNIIYLIDFGLSKRYKNPKTHQHIPYREGRALTGTARYVSINTHMGIEQSRRDDLESIGYMLIYFLKGVLPWQGLKNGNEKYTRIMEKKLQIPTEILCYGLPDEITYYLKYCKSLRFEDRPDYDYLRGLFIKLLGTCNSVYGLNKEMLKFDWCFDDPANSIWNIFNKKNKGINESKYGSSLNNKDKNEDNDNNINNNINNKKKSEVIKLKKQLSNIAEVNDMVSNENNPNYERSSESGDSEKNKEKTKKDILDKNLIKEEEGESKIDESEETVRESFQPVTQDMEPGKLSIELNNIFEKAADDNIDLYMNNLMNPAKLPNQQGENLLNLDEVEIIKNNNNPDEKKEENNLIENNNEKNGSLEDIKEESNKKELISSSNKASGEKNKDKEEEKQSVQVNKIKNNQSESSLIEEEKEKENSKKSPKELVPSGNLISTEKVNNNPELNSININSKNVTKEMEGKLDLLVNKENKLTFEQIHNSINNNINTSNNANIEENNKNEEKKEEEPKIEEKNINNENNNINNNENKKGTNIEKSLENKISEKNNLKAEKQEQDVIKHSKSNKLLNSINEKIKEDEKHENKDVNNSKKKEEDNNNYSKNFKTMRNKKSKERQSNISVTPNGETPKDIDISKMKVSKENMIKITTEPVANYYTIVKDLGHGSYGQVKKVKHKELGEIRAMKITNKKSDSSKYEIEILKKISHPNITKIFEIFSDSKKYYIIMEFLEGGELFEAITNIGSFTEASASKVLKQILSAVFYLHSNHIVHRDLKPENIMLTQKPKNGNYQIKLIDFGTAKIFKPGKKMNKFIGTSYYIAPEVLKERYDEKCDIWSCGVILFILLCGYPPFNGNTNVDIFHAIQNQNPIFGGEEWEDITPEAKDLIKLMLKKNPNERLNAEQCLSHKWFKIMESSERNKNQRISKQIQINAIQHMAQFVHENRFKQAVLQFISTQFNIQKEENDLKELFKSMDVSGTGQLTKDEFKRKLVELYGENDGIEMANGIFNSLDMDGSGKISYDEFLSAMINSQKVVTEERLKKAFRMFDKDNSGKLSVKEIRGVFGGTEEQWKQVIDEVDLNNDGEVDFEEFKIMMINMDKNQIIERKKSSVKSKSEVD